MLFLAYGAVDMIDQVKWVEPSAQGGPINSFSFISFQK